VTTQIFMSYARDDDLAPPGRDDLTKGLCHLSRRAVALRVDLAWGRRPKLWRDKRGIDPADQFDALIVKAIEDSQLLVVMLSRNWLARYWCRRELELFRAR
jgi:hypothetical protein